MKIKAHRNINIPKESSAQAMVTINLDAYFIHKRYDDGLLQFLKNDNYEEAHTYRLTMKNDGKLDQLYNVTMDLKFASWVNEDKQKKFDLADEQLRLFNRIAEVETDWIVYPLYYVAHQYLQIARKIRVKDDKMDKNAYLERCGRAIHRSFNLCLNDRNPELHENRKTGCYLLANLEFKLYHLLGNRDMMKNLVKVLQSRGDEIPPLAQSLAALHSKHLVMFNYYMGEYYGCYESDFTKGHSFLSEALLECATNICDKQIDKILILLIPFALLTTRQYPNVNVWQEKLTDNSVALKVHEPIVSCLLNGDLKTYDTNFAKNEIFFLQNGLYVAMSLLRELVFLRLVKNCWKFTGMPSVLQLQAVATAYSKSVQGYKKRKPAKADDLLLDELECQLANLIAKNLVKGYLSHANRCLVLSKKLPFPRQST